MLEDLTIRAAAPGDADALRKLAAHANRPPLRGHALLAELDGALVAAVALSSGAVVADKFAATADAVRLLRLRRYRVMRQGGDAAPARSLLRRLASATTAPPTSTTTWTPAASALV
jgi:hypothetical protein